MTLILSIYLFLRICPNLYIRDCISTDDIILRTVGRKHLCNIMYMMIFQDHSCHCCRFWTNRGYFCIMVCCESFQFYFHIKDTLEFLPWWNISQCFLVFSLATNHLLLFFEKSNKFRLPFYNEAKLAFIVYLWYPQTLVILKIYEFFSGILLTKNYG